ncbi:MAG TPA: hypothetical protein VHY37_08990, partial [Tepidisphaeraceae bacterium]|nr:hypothetical protein [Tepidisphaeraceae bacterium]
IIYFQECYGETAARGFYNSGVGSNDDDGPVDTYGVAPITSGYWQLYDCNTSVVTNYWTLVTNCLKSNMLVYNYVIRTADGLTYQPMTSDPPAASIPTGGVDAGEVTASGCGTCYNPDGPENPYYSPPGQWQQYVVRA